MSKERTEMEKRNVLRLSNEKSNQLTRECLQIALIHLMAEKELDKISITELVAKAGVSRTAFYSNYSSKEEILSMWLADFIDQLCALTRDALRRRDISGMYTLLFAQIRQDVDVFSVLIKANMQEMLFSRMEEGILKQFIPYDMQTKYLITALCGALNYLIIRWAKDGMVESADEIANLCKELTECYIHKLRLKYPDYSAIAEESV